VTFYDVTSGQKTLIRWILRNFRLRMRAPHPSKGTLKGHVTFYDVTSGEKALLGRILINFRLRMRITYFR